MFEHTFCSILKMNENVYVPWWLQKLLDNIWYQYMKAIGPTTSEKLHSQSEVGRTNEWMDKQTNQDEQSDTPKNYCMWGTQIWVHLIAGKLLCGLLSSLCVCCYQSPSINLSETTGLNENKCRYFPLVDLVRIYDAGADPNFNMDKIGSYVFHFSLLAILDFWLTWQMKSFYGTI